MIPELIATISSDICAPKRLDYDREGRLYTWGRYPVLKLYVQKRAITHTATRIALLSQLPALWRYARDRAAAGDAEAASILDAISKELGNPTPVLACPAVPSAVLSHPRRCVLLPDVKVSNAPTE